MTETEWLAGSDLWPMLRSRFGTMSRRQLMLFATVCCRRFGQFPDRRDRQLLDQAEDYADGILPPERFGELLDDAAVPAPRFTLAAAPVLANWERQHRGRGSGAAATAELFRVIVAWPTLPGEKKLHLDRQRRLVSGFEVVRNQLALKVEAGHRFDNTVNTAQYQESVHQANLLRHVVGNPYRQVAVAPEWLTWNGGTVPKLAHAIYKERDWKQLPVLADALEETGCTNAELLGHLRQPGEHMRGCWALDLLLGRA
jgi:hypothetical protein